MDCRDLNESGLHAFVCLDSVRGVKCARHWSPPSKVQRKVPLDGLEALPATCLAAKGRSTLLEMIVVMTFKPRK